jgi:glutathione synthase/RimK-type ligase-like ATP-grasp enzyme
MDKNILITLPEETEKTTDNYFASLYKVDEHDYLGFSEGLKGLGYNVLFANWKDYDFEKEEFTRMFNYNKSKFIIPEQIDDMKLIFLYKQEGFLFPENLNKFHSLVDRCERSNAVVVNDPDTIRWNISKEYMYELQKEGISVIPSYEFNESILKRIRNGETFIFKPKIGERGLNQKKIGSLDDLAGFNVDFKDYLVQEFCPSIRAGERSLVFVGQDYCHAVIKSPNPNNVGEYKCNESLGGTVKEYMPTSEELTYSKKLLKHISQKNKVIFSRIDLIDISGNPVLMEAELLNPSVYATYINKRVEFGEKVAKQFDLLIKRGE